MKVDGESEHVELISRLRKPIPLLETPGKEGVSDSEEEVYQGAILLQKIIKGRAIQTLVHIVVILLFAYFVNFFINYL
jgi:hypothetical protein